MEIALWGSVCVNCKNVKVPIYIGVESVYIGICFIWQL